MDTPVVIYWFRQDLRIADNPALSEAAAAGAVLPIYIFDDVHTDSYYPGGASLWWLYHSLSALQRALQGKLALYRGDPAKILPELASRYRAQAVYWNRCYEPWQVARDQSVETALSQHVHHFNGSLLWEPSDIRKPDGTPYKVFTPFFNKGCLTSGPPRLPLPKPKRLNLVDSPCEAVSIDSLQLLFEQSWSKKLEPHWTVGEEGATKQLATFLSGGLSQYKEGRDFPARKAVSRLSPHLHFGELSPHTVWHAAQAKGSGHNLASFLSELGWREFSYYLLSHFPALPRQNLQKKFDRFPWKKDEQGLRAWQRGETGYPFVDAGMRELWQTGYMHNRLRMVVGSFLVKNLLVDWRRGEEWFWDCLVDADLASNSASWQWVAGSGADAAPYFRIFNPMKQGQRFDPEGEYTRRFVPEIARLPDNYLFCPWKAPENVLQQVNLTLGKDYPLPIVDTDASRKEALAAFGSLS
ncbi:MAG: deoxyribodipyrimidine photo-lyase [Chlamydiota bacterium]